MSENVCRPNTKKCSVCTKIKVVGVKNWYANNTCAACYQKRYKLENPDTYRDIKLRHLYGISLDQYNAMLATQGHKCAICKRPDNKLNNGTTQNFVVDHRHSDKKVRALLCHTCNKNVGIVEKHVDVIQTYLRKY